MSLSAVITKARLTVAQERFELAQEGKVTDTWLADLFRLGQEVINLEVQLEKELKA